MSKKYVNKNCLVEVLKVTSDITVGDLQQFTGASDIRFSKEAVYITTSNENGVGANFGDFLIKDRTGCIFPVPEDIFESQYATVNVCDVTDNYSVARWLGFNPQSIKIQLGGEVYVECVRPDLSVVLSNGLVVPYEYYIIHNRENNSWCVLNPDTYNKLFRR